MIRALEVKHQWKDCNSWLREQKNMPGMCVIAEQARIYFDSIGCNEPMTILGAEKQLSKTSALTCFLSDQCLTDDIIDIGVEYIASQLMVNNNSYDKDKILLGTLNFSCMISAAKAKNVYQFLSTSLIKSYKDCLLNG